jgi:hypothetical protein
MERLEIKSIDDKVNSACTGVDSSTDGLVASL